MFVHYLLYNILQLMKPISQEQESRTLIYLKYVVGFEQCLFSRYLVKYGNKLVKYQHDNYCIIKLLNIFLNGDNTELKLILKFWDLIQLSRIKYLFQFCVRNVFIASLMIAVLSICQTREIILFCKYNLIYRIVVHTSFSRNSRWVVSKRGSAHKEMVARRWNNIVITMM